MAHPRSPPARAVVWLVDRELFERYQTALSTNADLCKSEVEALLARLAGLTPLDQAEYLMANYPKLVRAYGKVAADVARQFYQESRDAWYEQTDEEVSDFQAQCAPEIAEAWAHEDIRDAFEDGLGYLPKVAVRRTMQRADQTIALNVRRDSASGRWAIVPHPGACGWCVMVASNGWAYSERSVNAQRHDGCKCSVVVDFDRDDPSLAGYDVDALRRQYALGVDDAGGEEGIRAMWDALSPEEQARYRRKGRSAYDTFKTRQVSKAMDERAQRVSQYENHVRGLDALIKKATRGSSKKSSVLWQNRIGELLESVCPAQGSITSQAMASFEGKELETVIRLASEGRDCVFIHASGTPGSHTPDLLVDGKPVEVKRLEAWSLSRLGKKIWEASAQSRDVVIDLSLETVGIADAKEKSLELLTTPKYRYLSKYEKRHGASRGNPEIRVDTVTLVHRAGIEVVTRDS